jgi:hypothetical protein
MFDVFEMINEAQRSNAVPCKPKVCKSKYPPVQKEEGEKTPMFDTKRYLRDRIEDTWFDGKKALARKFNITENDPPQSAKELVDRIKSDEFTLPTTDEDGITAYGTGPYGLIWREPTKVADRKGYEEAAKALLETKKDTIDVIFALPEEDGLKALQDFKATVKALNS